MFLKGRKHKLSFCAKMQKIQTVVDTSKFELQRGLKYLSLGHCYQKGYGGGGSQPRISPSPPTYPRHLELRSFSLAQVVQPTPLCHVCSLLRRVVWSVTRHCNFLAISNSHKSSEKPVLLYKIATRGWRYSLQHCML